MINDISNILKMKVTINNLRLHFVYKYYQTFGGFSLCSLGCSNFVVAINKLCW